MATTINKQRLLNQLFGTANKSEGTTPEARPVLEEFIFGLCRESATVDQAEQAYRSLRQHFFDWNEVRVSSAREVEEVLADLPGSELRAQRLLSFLQEVFETDFSFDLETLHKKGVKQASKHLTRYEAASDYTCAWVVQRSLGGHAIPIDPPTLRCSRRLGLVETDTADVEAIRASLEHLVPKAKGPLFTEVISNLAAEFCWEEEPNCPSCPLAGECASCQEAGGNGLASRGHRAKPR